MAKKTKQDQHGDADLYDEKSNKGGSEHLESAADSDVGDYYSQLGKRPDPNYDRNPNLQIKQAPLDLSPADGGEGFVGSNTGPDVGLNVISGKKGYSENLPVWSQQSSFTDYHDGTGSEGNIIEVPEQDSRDEKADWKHPVTDNGMPQTSRTKADSGGAPLDNFDARDEGGGNPNTQSTPSGDAGNKPMMPEMPKTEFTDNDGGGAPRFKFSGQTAPESLYKPKPRD